MAIRCGEQLLNCPPCGSTDLTHIIDHFDPDVPNRSAWYGHCQNCGTQTFVPDIIKQRHKWPYTPATKTP